MNQQQQEQQKTSTFYFPRLSEYAEAFETENVVVFFTPYDEYALERTAEWIETNGLPDGVDGYGFTYRRSREVRGQETKRFEGFRVVADIAALQRGIDSAVYGNRLYISSQAIDSLLYGLNVERLAFIISEHIPEIVEAISQKLRRGATLLHGEGSYTGKERKIIMCAVKRQQIAALKNLVKDTDPDAFLIVTEANEVLGEGFSDYNRGI